MQDQSFIEKRLLIRESILGGSSIGRCASRMQQFFKNMKEGKPENILIADQEAFIRDLLLYKLEMGKFEKSIAVYDQEIEEYRELETITDQKIAATVTNIELLTKELLEEKEIRKYKEGLELKAKSVNTVPTRTSMKRKIDDLNDSAKKVQDQIGEYELRIDLRTHQFSQLLHSIEDLQKSLKEDDEKSKIALGVAADAEDEDAEDEDRYVPTEGESSRDKKRPLENHMDEINGADVVDEGLVEGDEDETGVMLGAEAETEGGREAAEEVGVEGEEVDMQIATTD